MIALILGGAPSVWDDLAAAETLLGSRPRIVVAANLAGIHYTGHLAAWASLHPDHLPRWIAQRAGSQDFRSFTPERCIGLPSDVVAERWPGSSGL